MDETAQRRKTTTRAAFVLSVTQWTCFAMELSLLAHIAKELGVDDVRYGYLSTTAATAQLITSPFYSRWAGMNLKRAVTIAFLSSSASYFLTALSNGFWLLLASRIASAFGHGPVAVQTAVAASTKPEERTAAFGKVGATIGIGFVLGSATGGALAHVVGLRAPLFAAGAAAFAAAFVGPWYIRISPKDEEKKHDEKGSSQGLQGYRRLLSSRRVLSILSAKTLSMAPAIIMLTIFVVYLINEFGTDPASNAVLTIYFGLCMTAMNVWGISLLKRHSGDRGLLLGGILAFALTGIGLLLVRSYYHFFFVMAVLVVGMCLVSSSTDSMLTASVPATDHALVLGLAWAVDSLTRVTGPTLAGYMLTQYGFSCFGYIQLVGVLGAVVLVYLFV